MYDAGVTSGVRLNEAQPDLCPYGCENELLPGCDAVLSDSIYFFFCLKLRQ